MYISTFLGNYGQKYKETRHNLGWMILSKLSFYNSLNWNKKFKGEYSKYSDLNSVLLKPLTLMNNSGQSVSAALSFFKIKTEDLIIIHDDLELPYGVIQLKKGGGTGGHNGLRSIVKETGNNNFYRLRLGISRPPSGRDVASYVLNKFSKNEEAILEEYCEKAANYFENCLKGQLKQSQKIDLVNFF
ncbi:MAG: aminoacyl-tRNA hydrolase [Spirochaetales bacterium]|nr:aminoacyl-tRNA hydrolase [Spirochaetales bacterium]